MHIQLEFPNGTETGWKVGLELLVFLNEARAHTPNSKHNGYETNNYNIHELEIKLHCSSLDCSHANLNQHGHNIYVSSC